MIVAVYGFVPVTVAAPVGAQLGALYMNDEANERVKLDPSSPEFHCSVISEGFPVPELRPRTHVRFTVVSLLDIGVVMESTTR